jgi:protein-tyrosine phosphatase
MTGRWMFGIGVLLLTSLIASAGSLAADRPVRIAMVDTGNTGRSVTAEALATSIIAKQKLNAVVISRAVDLNPYNIHPEENFVTLLRARDIDIAAHLPAQFGAQEAKYSDVILTMTEAHKAWIVSHFPEAKDKVFTLGEYVTGGPSEVLDAYGKPLDFYKTVLVQLDQLVEAAVEKAVRKPG